MKSFNTYGAAKAEADKKARELSQGSQSLALTTKEVAGALAIRDTLDTYRRETGRTIAALQAVKLAPEVGLGVFPSTFPITIIHFPPVKSSYFLKPVLTQKLL